MSTTPLPKLDTVDRRVRWRIGGLLIAILALAAFLRFHTLTDRGFFFDELWNLQLANGHGSAFLNLPTDRLIDEPNTLTLDHAQPIWRVPGNITGAIHPPGLFLMLRLWREVFGDSMFAIRSFSATWSMLVVLLVFVAGRLSFNTSVGLWAALMSALAFNNIDQAQDTRGYTLLQCELLLTMIALLLTRRKSSSWIGATAIGLGTLAMMLTHYFAAGACAAIVVGVIILLHGRARYQALGAIVAGGLIWLIVWLPQLRAQLAFVSETADGFLLDKTGQPLFSTLKRLAAAPYQAMVGDPRNFHPVTIVGGLFIAALLIVAIAFRRDARRRIAFCWLATILGVFGSLLALDLIRQTAHLEFVKYLILTTPAICVLLASIDLRRSWLVPGIVSIALVALLFSTPIPVKPDERAMTTWLKERMRPGDVIILPSYNAPGRDGQVMSLYFEYGVPLDRFRMLIPVRKPPAAVIDALPRDVRWFYYAFDSAYQPTDWLPRVEVVDRGPADVSAVYEIRPRPARATSSTSATTRAGTAAPTTHPARAISLRRRWPDPATRPANP